MTQDEFLQQLSQLHAEWAIHSGCIRKKRLDALPDMCPIEAVAGKYRAYSLAGPALGLSPDLVEAIVRAADKHPAGYNQELRALLLRAVRLPEEDPDKKAEPWKWEETGPR